MFCLRLVLLLVLVTGTLEDGFDLAGAFDDDVPKPTTAKPKAPEKPKSDGGYDLSDAFGPDLEDAFGPGGYDLSDVFGPDEPLPTKKPSKPNSGDSDLEDDVLPGGLDLSDVFRPAVKPSAGPSRGDCQSLLVHKLNLVLENQRQQLRLLQLMVRSNSQHNDRTVG